MPQTVFYMPRTPQTHRAVTLSGQLPEFVDVLSAQVLVLVGDLHHVGADRRHLPQPDEDGVPAVTGSPDAEQ